jgi:hypothetical protein
MNTNALARQYDKLTPWERLPLILAAIDRGDDVEADRLANSAPLEWFRMSDFYALAEGMLLAGLFHMINQLDRIALYWQAQGIADRYWELATSEEEQAKAERVSGSISLLAYRITVEAEAWKRFCADLQLDPEAQLRGLPSYDTLKRGEEGAALVACDPEQAEALFRRAGRQDCALPSVEDAAKAMRAFLDCRVARWS